MRRCDVGGVPPASFSRGNGWKVEGGAGWRPLPRGGGGAVLVVVSERLEGGKDEDAMGGEEEELQYSTKE